MVLLGVVGAYFVWTCSRRARLEFRGWLLRPPGALIGAIQIIAGTLDLGMSCAVLWLMLPATAHVEFVAFAGAYAIGGHRRASSVTFLADWASSRRWS